MIAMGQQALGQPLNATQQQDPRSVYLAQALQSMGQGTADNRTPGAMGLNLLGEALGQYGLQRRRDQLQNVGRFDPTLMTTKLDPNALPQFPMIGPNSG